MAEGVGGGCRLKGGVGGGIKVGFHLRRNKRSRCHECRCIKRDAAIYWKSSKQTARLRRRGGSERKDPDANFISGGGRGGGGGGIQTGRVSSRLAEKVAHAKVSSSCDSQALIACGGFSRFCWFCGLFS